MSRKTVKRIKTGAFERRFSLAKAGLVVGARYAALSAGNLFTGKDKRQQRNREILSEQAQWLATELGKLKGSVVKVGQMMALFGEHFLPKEVTSALHTLEDNTTALEWSAIEPYLRNELGERYNELTIEPYPIGAASLGQVHRATRKSDGRQVCLKIQYPGVAAAIDSDLQALVGLLKLTRLVPITEEFNSWLDEVHAMLSREVDYHLELETTHHFHTLLQDDPRFIVPEVFPEYSSGNVLCTSYEPGYNVNSEEVLNLPQERRNAIGMALIDICCQEVFVWSKMQTDPNFGNYFIRLGETAEEDRIVLLDFGAIRDFDDVILEPGREMIRGAYHHNKQKIIQALDDLNFMNKGVPHAIIDEFTELCFMAVEVLANPERFPPPAHVLNENGEYLWRESDLPNRVTTLAAKNAFSIHFDVPPKEFIFLTRKLLGAYTFLHVIGAETKGYQILEKYL